uniref:HAT C-terminal dimerisation domain-containing protein n=1 Tax=Latimeria chalumnae TaxID=7897 RepID=H2ZS46_LATCH
LFVSIAELVSHGGYNDISRHIATEKHVSCAKAATQSKLASFFPPAGSKMSDSVTKAEVLFTGFLLEHNIPLAGSDHVRHLFKKTFPDSKIAKSYACASTKTTHIIHFGLALDASSDEFEKYFPIFVTYEVHTQKPALQLDTVSCTSNKSQELFDATNNALSKHNVDWNKCATYSTDNTANMQGKHNSILSQVKAKQTTNQEVYAVGCPYHLVHLMAEHTSKSKQMNVEDMIIDIYYHFQRSVKRAASLNEYMAFCNISVKKIVKHVIMRWLSLERSTKHTLITWDGLYSYFVRTFDEEKQRGAARPQELRILMSFKNPLMKVYLLFLHAVLPMFNKFNLLFQTKSTDDSPFAPSNDDVIQRFVQPSVVAVSENVTELNYKDSSMQLPASEVFVGFETHNYARKENMIDIRPYKTFLVEAVQFFCKALDYMKKAMPLEDPVLKSLAFFYSNQSFCDIEVIVDRFPDVISAQQMDPLLSKFRDYQVCDTLLEYDSTMRTDEFWHKISQM